MKSSRESVAGSVSSQTPIAVVGASARFPGAPNLEQFWSNLKQGVDSITEIPSERWDWKQFYGDPREKGNRTASKWGGFVPDFDLFDAAFFGINRKEAELMDPQQRLLLELSWLALENAAIAPASLKGRLVGVFVGACNFDYSELIDQHLESIESHAATGNFLSILANRLSYHFDFRGPSVTVDTACSASLTSVHQACQAIRNGECELALAGGVNLCWTEKRFIAFSRAGMLSPDGRCKTFDASANGYVRGEGAGVVVLKSLAQAEADGESILAVIRGSLTTHGGRANALTVPNPEAQAELIRRSYQAAGVDPASVGYIETHGTGTMLGDPMEIMGLKKGLMTAETSQSKDRTCFLGSVKSNIGHLEAAAGIAGLLKSILMLREQYIPKTLHVEELNSLIKLEETPFQVAREGLDWKVSKNEEGKIEPRRAGVSSFSFGGAYAHCVLEEYPSAVVGTSDPQKALEAVVPFYFSARTEGSLRSILAAFLKVGSDLETLPLRDIAWTLHRRYEAMPFSFRIEANSHQKLLDGLQTSLREENLELVELAKEPWQGPAARVVELPAYIFERERFWIKEKALKPLPVGEPLVASDCLGERFLDELISIIAEGVNAEKASLSARTTFESLALDSIFIDHLNFQLEEILPDLPQTLFYEYDTIGELNDALCEEHAEALRGHFEIEGQACSATTNSLPPNEGAEFEAATEEQRFAIIGLDGRYPGAGTLDAFWQQLEAGQDSVTEIPPERWDWQTYYDADPEQAKNGRMYCRWGAFLEGIDEFDPIFFGIAPKDAALMDPQERLFLQVAWKAIEEAGYRPEDLAPSARGNRVGVFAGVTAQTYSLHGPSLWQNGSAAIPNSFEWSLANRVSYHLDFVGPSVPVDTACSSSLTALHMACASLRAGDCEVALVGGVNLYTHPSRYVNLCQMGMLSATGKCHSFGDQADGFVPGEGVGVLVIKPLSKALQDGDRIHGIIAGTAVNHGGHTSGFTVPNPTAQAELIKDALARSGLEPERVSYLEAHGTGTALGDPIEVRGLSLAFGTDREEVCSLGSVKSNIGHLEAAAGIAGITKVLLQFKHRKIAPSLHAEKLNPRINFETSGFQLKRTLTPWNSVDGVPRVAGVSSFGAGGANAHVLLEEPPAGDCVDKTCAAEGPLLFVFSARQEMTLNELVKAYRSFLTTTNVDPESLAYTLQFGRVSFEHRLAIVATSLARLQERLDDFDAGREHQDLFVGEAGEEAPVPKAEAKLHDLARSWVAGASLDMTGLYDGCKNSRVTLPTYPFVKRSCWFETSNITSGDSKGFAKAWEALDRWCVSFAATLPTRKSAQYPELAHALENLAVRVQEDLPNDPLQVLGDLEARYPQLYPQFNLLRPCAEQLSAVLRGERTPHEVLFPQASMDLVKGVYAEGAEAEEAHSQIGAYISEQVDRPRLTPLKILEVGAGTGATSELVLQVLQAAGVDFEYIFTDVAKSLLVRARERFKNESVQFRLFDAESGMLDGGSAISDCDFVIATNALHAVADIEKALGLLKTTLKPDGQLLLIEATIPHPFLTLTFGLLPEWWDYQDARQPDSPVLSIEQWQACFQRNGFEAGRVLNPDWEGLQHVLVAPLEAVTTDSQWQVDEVEVALCETIAAVLGAETGEIRVDRPPIDYGVDSLSAVEIITRINLRFSVNLKAGDLFNYPSVKQIAEQVAGVPRLKSQTAPVKFSSGLRRQVEPEQVQGESAANSDIAVIGMSGLFPDASDIEHFWENLKRGHQSTREIPASRWPLEGFYSPTPDPQTESYCKSGAFLNDIEYFDPLFFDISPREAELMDPQQRLFLQETWKALELAGYPDRDLDGTACSVFVGYVEGDYRARLKRWALDKTAHAFTGNAGSVLASRIAYFLNLKGAAIAMDTACSSSLVAIHQACESLRSGESSLAIAGGVNLYLEPDLYVMECAAGMLAPDGRSKAFDDRADGFGMGEAVGVVVLKRLADAIRDGDSIAGVIKGSAINQDGRTNGMTAPNGPSQTAVECSVYERFGIHPESIGYLEAHGTGTRLGDPIEVDALTAAFRNYTERRQFCHLGTAKSNVGHCQIAAGVVGLIKCLLMVQRGYALPLAGFEEPNQHIDFKESPFQLVTEGCEWDSPDKSRRAAINAFGFSGTNVHAVVENFAAAPVPTTRRADGPVLVVLSARDVSGLWRQLESMDAWLKSESENVDLYDLAYTLLRCRSWMAVRCALVVESIGSLQERLEVLLANRRFDNLLVFGNTEVETSVPKKALQRLGQGVLHSGISGQDSVTRDDLDLLAELFAWRIDLDWDLLYPRGSGQTLALPVYAFARERCWIERMPSQAIPASQNVATFAGELDFSRSTGVGLVFKKFLHPREPWIAQHQVDGEHILPGVSLIALALEAAVPLSESASVVVENVTWMAPCKVSRTGTSVRIEITALEGNRYQADICDDATTFAQMTLSADLGGECSVEFSSRLELDGAVVMTADALYCRLRQQKIEHGSLYQRVETIHLLRDRAEGRIDASAEALGCGQFPFTVLDAALQVPAALEAPNGSPVLPHSIAQLVWRGASTTVSGIVNVTAQLKARGVYDLIVHDSVSGELLGWLSGVVYLPVANSDTIRSFSEVMRPVIGTGAGGSLCEVPKKTGYLLIVSDQSSSLSDGLTRILGSRVVDHVSLGAWPDRVTGESELLFILQAPESASGIKVWRTDCLHPLIEAMKSCDTDTALNLQFVLEKNALPTAALLSGLLQSVSRERPNWSIRIVEVEPEVAEDYVDLQRLHDWMLAWPLETSFGRYFYQKTVFWEHFLVGAPLPVPECSAFTQEGHYFIIGGAGGIGFETSLYLARTYRARITWTGRRPLDTGIEARLDQIRQEGGQAAYQQANLSDAVAMQSAWESSEKAMGRIAGVIHSAIVLDDSVLDNLDAARVERVLEPKVDGMLILGDLLARQRPDFLLSFSSVQTFSCDAGQANYASASSFQDAYTLLIEEMTGVRTRVLNWGYWGSVGVVSSEDYRKRLSAMGVGSIEPVEGMQAMEQFLASDLSQGMLIKASNDYLESIQIQHRSELQLSNDTFQSVDKAIEIEPLVLEETGILSGGFAALAECTRAGLFRVFRDAGLFREAGQVIEASSLAAQLNLVDSYRPLFRELLLQLKVAGYLKQLEVGTFVVTEASVMVDRQFSSALDSCKGLSWVSNYQQLVSQGLEGLLDLLAGKRKATELLFPNGDSTVVSSVYRGDSITHTCNRQIARLIKDAVLSSHEPLTILEVGAGTGATSEIVLEVIAAYGEKVKYYYTDVSPAFVAEAEARFSKEYPFIEFKLLNLEQNPYEQGWDAGQCDLVFGTNVLHATSNLNRSIHHLGLLMKPDSQLLLNEATRVIPCGVLTFGLTPGWWLFEDASLRLQGGPLASIEGWSALLESTGFSRLQIFEASVDGPASLEQCVFVARKTAASIRYQAADVSEFEQARKTVTVESPVEISDVQSQAVQVVKEVFVEVLKIAPERLAVDLGFEKFGVDSLVTLNINKALEKRLGRLPSSLLFEYPTIRQLAKFIAGKHIDRVRAHFASAGVMQEQPVVKRPPLKATAPPAPVAKPTMPTPAEETREVAIIGVSGRYPESPDLAAYWEQLKAGRNCIQEIPADRWDWRHHKHYTRWGGFIEEVDQFDPLFFGITPKEAEGMDPQERLFLQTVWHALEDSAYAGERLDDVRDKTGVFVGVMSGNYDWLGLENYLAGGSHSAHAAHWSKANRVSYHLDLGGPSMTVDTACSSSLTALHLACQSILNGESALAIAGGVNLILHPLHYERLCRLSMLSHGDRCRSFGEGADGFVDGEGVGAVILKERSAAERDGDRILAVIEGSALNAGGKTKGFTVPNPRAQGQLVRDALKRTSISAKEISYIETHGTGTELGDPLEISGLMRAFPAADDWRCVIGSVKSNIGHLESAAGIAGLTKILLQMKHRQLVPSLHSQQLNEGAQIEDSPFTVQQTLTDWDFAGDTLHAGISSFGAGGANAHVIVRSHEAVTSLEEDVSGPQWILLSAHTEQSAEDYAAELLHFIDESSWVSRDEELISLTTMLSNILNVPEGSVDADESLEALGLDEVGAVLLLDAFGGPSEFKLKHARDSLALSLVDLSKGQTVSDEPMGLRLRDLAYTLKIGRAALRCRYAIWVESIEELKEELKAWVDTNQLPERWCFGEPTVGASDTDARWLAGESVVWSVEESALLGKVIELPLYVFDERRCWLPEAQKDHSILSVAEAPRLASVDGLLFGPSWTRLAVSAVAETVEERNSVWITDETQLRALRFEAGGVDTIHLYLAEWTGVHSRLSCEALIDHLDAVVGGLQALAEEHGMLNLKWMVYTVGGSGPDTGADPFQAAVVALMRSVVQELPRWELRCLDLFAAMPRSEATAWGEYAFEQEHLLLAVREDSTYALDYVGLESVAPPQAKLRPSGHYVLIGGAGGIGFEWAQFLARNYEARLTLVGRSELNDRIAEQLNCLNTLGAETSYVSADLSDPGQMDEMLAHAGEAHGPLHGVFVGALVLADSSLMRLDRVALAKVIRPKFGIAKNLFKAVEQMSLDFITVFSSALSIYGSQGQANYAAASAAMNAYCGQMRARVGYPVKVIDWGFWGQVGAVATDGHRDHLASMGLHALTVEEGMSAVVQSLSLDTNDVVCLRATEAFLQKTLQPVRVKITPVYDSRADTIAEVLASFDELNRYTAAGLMDALGLEQLLTAGRAMPLETLYKLLTGIAGTHRPLFNGLIDILCRAGYVEESSTGYRLGKRRSVSLLKHTSSFAHGRLLDICLNKLSTVLRGELSAPEVLFPGGTLDLVEPIYRGNPIVDCFNTILADALKAYLAEAGLKHRPIRILEIGAGTGSATDALLPILQTYEGEVIYDYTDVSEVFLKQAKLKYQDSGISINYRLLDIGAWEENDPSWCAYDVVVASNVLHATGSIRGTLQAVHQLLEDEGHLLMVEITTVMDFNTATFGLLEGWWLFEDGDCRLPHSPLIGKVEWERLIAEAGFTQITTPGVSGDSKSAPPIHVFTAVNCRIEHTEKNSSATQGLGETIFSVMGGLLGMRSDDFNAQTSFRDIGVDSIQSIQVIDGINEALGIRLKSVDLFNYTTVAKLEAFIRKAFPEMVSQLETRGEVVVNGDGRLLELLQGLERGETEVDFVEAVLEGSMNHG